MAVKGKHLAIIAIGIVIVVLVIPGQPFQLTFAPITAEKVSLDQTIGGVQ